MQITKYFSPDEDLTAEQNLYDFIKIAKYELTIFGKDLEFDGHVWDITDTISGKQNTRNRLIFSNLGFSKDNRKTKDDIVPMREPFLSFSKAYLRYQQGMSPIKSFTPLLASMRILEHALIDMTQSANPINISTDVLNRAIELGRENFTPAVLYRLGGHLERFAKFITDKRISNIPVDWKNPVKRPEDTQRVGKKADDDRNKKMPSKRALDVLPQIFFAATEPKDVFVTSVVAILFGSPDRIGEVLLLQEHCEITQKDSKGNELYGLRWFPQKGAEPMIKWIIPSMVDTVKTAINRIRELSIEARIVAKWYENNPKKVYLPPSLEYLRKRKFLTTKDISMILYGKESKYMTTMYKHYDIPYVVENKKSVVSFKDFEKAMINLLPKDFPYINKEKKFKYSESLLIQRTNEYHEKKSTLVPTVEGFSIGFIGDALGGRSNILSSSIFEKFGYRENSGLPIKVTTHQFRHYLNTLAQKGGASQLDIAKWSGRKDVNQNAAYNHVSADEMLALIQDAVGDENAMSGALSNIEGIKKKVVISRDEYAQLKIRTAHKTDFGVCVHDFSMMPCQMHMDCINCTEQVCIKGDKNSNERIRQRKFEVEEALKIAQAAQEDGQIGANRWTRHQTLELEKLTQLCEIFDNQDVPGGSIIQISNTSAVSSIEQSQVRHNGVSEDPIIDMDEMKDLLEDLGGI